MRKILIADDSTTIRQIVEHTFSEGGFQVVLAADGRQAIDLARKELPDLVLCDVLMPGLSGYEVAETLSRDPESGGVPVLLLTGAFEPFDEERASRCGAAGYLPKPFEIRVLKRRVDELLSAHPAATPRRTVSPPAPQPFPEELFSGPISSTELPQDAVREALRALSPEPEPQPVPEPPPAPNPFKAFEELFPTRVPLPGDEDFRLDRPLSRPTPSESGSAVTAPNPVLVPKPGGAEPPAGPTEAAVPPAPAPGGVPSVVAALTAECRAQVAALAPDLIREVAWEVVPDLIERLLREHIKAHAALAGRPPGPTGE